MNILIILIIITAIFGIILLIRVAFDIKNAIYKIVDKKLKEQDVIIDLKIKTTFNELQKQDSDRFNVAYRSLELDMKKLFFDESCYYFSRNGYNNVAKTEKNVQDSSADDLWQSVDKLRVMRESIANGNHDDYRNLNELSELAPLDAWKMLDSKIADLESFQNHTAFSPEQVNSLPKRDEADMSL